jgi:hypothetical protein
MSAHQNPLRPQVREFIGELGIENLGKRLVNSREGKVSFERPRMTLDVLMHFGQALVEEQVGGWAIHTRAHRGLYVAGARQKGRHHASHACIGAAFPCDAGNYIRTAVASPIPVRSTAAAELILHI